MKWQSHPSKILKFPNALSLSPGSKISFSEAEYAGKRKKTRREVFLIEMEQVVPWIALLKVIELTIQWPDAVAA